MPLALKFFMPLFSSEMIKGLQKKILDHALDEYRHSQYFYNLYKEEGKIEKISSRLMLL